MTAEKITEKKSQKKAARDKVARKIDELRAKLADLDRDIKRLEYQELDNVLRESEMPLEEAVALLKAKKATPQPVEAQPGEE